MLATPHSRPSRRSENIRARRGHLNVFSPHQLHRKGQVFPGARETKRISNVHRHAIKPSPYPEAEGIILPVTQHSGDEQARTERGWLSGAHSAEMG